MGNDIERLSCGYCEQQELFIIKNGKHKTVKFPANVFLIPFEDGFMLFDTGYAGDFNDLKKNFWLNLYSKILPTYAEQKVSCYSQLMQKNIDINKIKYIFISHFHPDHIGGLRDFKEQKFICSKYEYQNLKGLRKKFADLFLPKDFSNRVTYIEDFEEAQVFPEFKSFKINDDLFAILLAGHTDYQYGIFCKSANTLIVADAIWTDKAYKDLNFPNDIAFCIMENKNAYKNTVKKIKNVCEREHLTVLYSHQEFV